jgi:ribosomal protein L11 methyltransferase
MNYTELTCFVSPADGLSEVLVALLGEAGYEMFEDFESGVRAYIRSSEFNPTIVNQIESGDFLNGQSIKCELKEIAGTNWNEVWESNFQPVLVGGKLLVRAEYHATMAEYPLELIVQPRMAFGTGHHATTYLMLEGLLKTDLKGKSVLDMGCGTGILAILASKLGASLIKAVDIDPNSVENTIVNCSVNDTTNIEVEEGTMASIAFSTYDVLIANINRNIILADLSLYARSLAKGGVLFTSGYYVSDLPMITEAAIHNGLTLEHYSVKDDWCCAIFIMSKS